jgi:hypothetical protein
MPPGWTVPPRGKEDEPCAHPAAKIVCRADVRGLPKSTGNLELFKEWNRAWGR